MLASTVLADSPAWMPFVFTLAVLLVCEMLRERRR